MNVNGLFHGSWGKLATQKNNLPQ